MSKYKTHQNNKTSLFFFKIRNVSIFELGKQFTFYPTSVTLTLNFGASTYSGAQVYMTNMTFSCHIEVTNIRRVIKDILNIILKTKNT